MTTIKNLGRGVESVFIENNRFNTTMISVNFYLPLVREKIAAAALLPYLLTSCSAEYPDFSALNLKLLSLYSADIGGSADRVGDNQWLRFYCNVLNDDVVDEPVLDTAALLLALANQILSAFGKSPLPIESSTVEQLVTTGITTVTALINWWYNNSFTQAAMEADKTYDRMKQNGF